jgi:sugar phosphate isomerase/epimerase
MPDDSAPIERLSLNQITTDKNSLQATVEACARHGYPWIGAWRHKIADDPSKAGKLFRDAGIRVSSLCRGGFFPAATETDRKKRIQDNLRAIDEAAAIGTDLLVLVCGPAPDRDQCGARQMVMDGISQIVEYAEQCKIRLGIEPLHPMYAADRSVIVTLAQANDIAEQFPSERVGVIVDVFHVWWDPQVYSEIGRAGQRIFGFHVSDWVVPLPDLLMGRAIMGEGVIDSRRLRTSVEEAGYGGPIEVEIFNEQVWSTPIDELLPVIRESYLRSV